MRNNRLSQQPIEAIMFQLAKNGTNIRTEVVAGFTTFLTMAYIIFVNPAILADAGMDQGAVFVATCLAAIVGTLIMGLYANYPIALAPGMGLNAFFTYTVVLTYGFTWQQALGAVFCSGVLFVLLSLSGIREAVINAIPHSLKMAVSAGVGLFLGIIAMQNAGIIVDHPATLVTVGNLLEPAALLALLGFVLIAVLNHFNVLGATVLGILAVTLLGMPLGLTEYAGLLSMPPDVTPTLLALDLSRVLEVSFLIVVFSMLFVDLFDTAGTLIGVTHRAGLLDEQGRLPRMKQALLADSSATVAGALVGTSNTTSYIESASGVAVGGRTGLASVITALCFGLALFFAPLAGMIPAYATAAALIYVACVMSRALTEIDWDDATEYAPAVVTALTMPLTYSIATGIGLGFIVFTLMKLFAGQFKQVSPALVLLSIAFCVFFAVQGQGG
jgi:adenine/guanine/hypoxanthine permease